MQLKSLLLAGGALLSGATAAHASGFQVGLTGAKNVGMASAGTGLYLDQSSQFFNPAASVFAPTGFVGNVNFVMARLAFRPELGAAQQGSQPGVVTPFSAFVGFGPKDGKWRLGIGAYTPFGNTLKYQDGWDGRYALTSIELRSVFAQATAAYAITPQLSVGAGLVMLAVGSVDLSRDIPVQGQGAAQPANITLSGTAERKFGYNLGVLFKPSKALSLGFNYRSALNATVNGGTVTLTGVPAAVGSRFTATGFNTNLPLPDVFSLGVGVRPTDKLLVAFDVNLTGFSSFQELRFDYTGGVIGGNTSTVSKRQYQDNLTFRLGTQYTLTDKFTLRAGALYDQTAVPDGFVTPETPDGNRWGLSAGFSYMLGERFGLDGSFLFQQIMERTQTQAQLQANGVAADRVAGTYKTNVAVPGFGVHYNF